MKENIVGQQELVDHIDRIFEIFETSNGEIRPHFILTGPSGSGKTFTIENLARGRDLNYFEINAASLTKEGTAGNSLSKALTPLMNAGDRLTVCFVDEFDKLFIAGNTNSELAHESSTGVQNEFLKVLESSHSSVFGDYGKYVAVPTDKVLFVFAGAFNNEPDLTIDRLRDIGLKTEFLGRVGLVYNALPLSLDALYAIVDKSKLLNEYLELFENVDREEVVFLLKGYIKKAYEMNTIGARLVNTLIHQYFIMGKLPEKEIKKITFTKKLQLKPA